jgi:hypothetical protein
MESNRRAPPDATRSDADGPRDGRGRGSPAPVRERRRRTVALTGGGTDGNEQLTAETSVVLIALLAVIGVTILRIGQLISVHLFVGLVLIGPVALKLASTGYRFARYYTRDPAYRGKGPPEPLLRLVGPVVALSTIVVFGSGIALLLRGPSGRGQLLLLHKVSFVAWGVFTAFHVLGHLGGIPGSLRAVRHANAELSPEPGRARRWMALLGALAAGLVLALVLTPEFGAWTHHTLSSHER